jgi:hypothetical protein
MAGHVRTPTPNGNICKAEKIDTYFQTEWYNDGVLFALRLLLGRIIDVSSRGLTRRQSNQVRSKYEDNTQ